MCCFVKFPLRITSILVGRIPDATQKSTKRQNKSKHRHTSLSQSSSLNQIEPNTNQLSSDSDSPLTVMENSHGQDQRSQRQTEKCSSKHSASREEAEDQELGKLEVRAEAEAEAEAGVKENEGERETRQQRPTIERRKSVSHKHQYPFTSSEIEGDPIEGAFSRGKSVAQQQLQQRQQQEAEESSNMNRDLKIGGELRLEGHKNQHSQRQKANLLRQSASAAAVDEDNEASRIEFARRQSIKQLKQVDGEQPRESYHRDEDQMARQESVSTIDSQKSQHSDSATQTVNEDRLSRRRRSRRSSSKRRGSSHEGEQASIQDKSQEYHNAEEHDSIQQQTLSGIAAVASSSQDEHTQQQLEGDNEEEFEVRKRASRSQPPVPRQINRTLSRSHLRDERATMLDSRRAVSVSPSITTNINIRNVLENVAPVEGPFQEPQLAFKVAMDALEGPCWSTKVEGILALIRLVTFHQPLFLNHLHEIVGRIVAETRNLRSTVSRSAIFALGDFCAKLERLIEPELDVIVQALLLKSIENTAFIRDDIRKALSTILDHVTQWRFANALIHHGSNHKNMHVRRMASRFVAQLVERMGPTKCLIGAREISAQLIPATAKFAQDSSPHTRYYGRLILAKLLHHNAFDRLLRKNLAPNMYRSTIGIIESVKRRGPGEAPPDN